MRTTTKALLAALMFTAAAPVPALAAQRKQAQPAPAAAQPALSPSKEARPALAALQAAVTAGKTAEIPALAQAALAAAKTPVDRYFAYQLQLKPAIDAKNDALTLSVLEGMIASGVPQGSQLANLAFNAAKLHYNSNALDAASAQLDRALGVDANNADFYVLLGELRNKQKRPAEAVAALQKAVELQQAAGKPVDQRLSDRALAFAYNNRLPVARDLALANLRRAPTSQNWRNAIKIFDQTSNLQAADKIDLFRLQRLTKSMDGEGDYYPYVDALLTRGLPGEAKAVLDEAFAAGKLDQNKATWKELHGMANARVASDRAGLAAGEKAALAAAAARPAVNTADALLSYGEYARAVALYRAALGKSGVDADLVNLRLGIALARSGDTAGAQTALNAVKGSRAGIAQMWLFYLQNPTTAA